METHIHIGTLIRQKIEERGHTIVWVSEQFGCERTKIHRILKSKDLYGDTLDKICKILKYNFFHYYTDKHDF